MKYYSHKKFTVSVERAKEDVEILNEYGSTWAAEGDLIAKDLEGRCFKLNDSEFESMYVPVQRVQESNANTGFEGLDVDYIAEMYQQGWVGDEDQEYIERTLELQQTK